MNSATSGDITNMKSFHRTSALAMGAIALLLLLVAIVVNLCLSRYQLLVPTAITALLISISLFWLCKHPHHKIPRFYNGISLTLLGICLLITHNGLNDSSILWLMLSPPMFMFCLGLRVGTIAFLFFYFLLALLLLTVWPAGFTSQTFTTPRLLTGLLGIFLFAWVTEYVRFRIQQALAQAVMRLKREARTDSLTGLGNRREFNDHFNWLLAQTRRGNEDFVLIMVDIDHFKRVNDNYGHDIGDKVLHHMACLLGGSLRSADRVFRWGGEEFAILLPSTSLAEGVALARRLCQLVETNPFVNKQARINLTVSIGVYRGNPSESLDEHIKRVDNNLYTAKNGGRNQVCSGLFELESVHHHP